MNYFTLKDFNLENKRVFLRVDFNVPIDEKGRILDDFKIRRTLPTIRYLLKNRAKIILATHLGRPEKKEKRFCLDHLAQYLSKLIKAKVYKLNDYRGKIIHSFISHLKEKEIILLENLRFYPEEEKNDLNFAKELSELADFYLNEAFAVSHRSHASIVGLPKFIPGGVGLLMEREIEMLNQILSPEKPLVVLFGGAKISDKIETIKNLAKKADYLLIGGAMANSFLRAKGHHLGLSKIDATSVKIAEKLLRKYKQKIILPEDVVISDQFSNQGKKEIVKIDKIPSAMIIMDIGPKTAERFKEKINLAKTVFWNGPLGVFELEKFSSGTRKIGQTIAKSSALTMAGGGETIQAIEKFRIKGFRWLSTGGGASLEFLSGKKLPGIKTLEENFKRFKKRILA